MMIPKTYFLQKQGKWATSLKKSKNKGVSGFMKLPSKRITLLKVIKYDSQTTVSHCPVDASQISENRYSKTQNATNYEHFMFARGM
jgi:hypothetical protein